MGDIKNKRTIIRFKRLTTILNSRVSSENLEKLKEDLGLFTKTVGKIKKYPAFLIFSLALFFLPGSNYYLDLELNPQPPFIKSLPIDIHSPSRYPVKKQNVSEPWISARSSVIIDVKSGATLFSKNPDEKLLPASTTKIMTAMVVLKNYPLDQIITVRKADKSRGQTMDLITGERISVDSLLYGLLMHSGNDAAYALAENFDGGYFAFVEEMNNLATSFHLENTHFANVSGIDQQGHYTTVKDLARLAVEAMQDPRFSKIVSTKEKTVQDLDNIYVHKLSNRNELLGIIEGIRGVKTGWTEQAKECLVTDTERSGNEIITVVLGSNDRFGESEKLIEWAYASFTWIEPENL